jgi:hypothetical protein
MRIARILAAIAVSSVAIVALGGSARADGKAWTAAKAGLPADTKLVVGIDVATVQKTQLFATYYPKLHDKPEAAKVLDAIKDGCKLDPVSVVQSLVVAAADDDQDGAIYVAVTGIDKAKLSSCLQATAKTDDKGAKVAIKHTGNITEVTKGDETVYFGWVGKDVLVVPFRAKDKPALTRWMGGKGALAKSDVGKALAKINTSATVWGAGSGTKEIQPGVNAKGGYGTVNYAKGTLNADIHAVMETAEQASNMATTASQQLDQAKSGPLPPEFVAMLKAITVTSDKDEVRIKANVAEKDVLGAVAFALSTLGGP